MKIARSGAIGVDRVMVSIDGESPRRMRMCGAMLSQVVENIRGLNTTKHALGSLFPAVGIEFVALKQCK
jgi:hypothetical protein